jgi:hypothetical protein
MVMQACDNTNHLFFEFRDESDDRVKRHRALRIGRPGAPDCALRSGRELSGYRRYQNFIQQHCHVKNIEEYLQNTRVRAKIMECLRRLMRCDAGGMTSRKGVLSMPATRRHFMMIAASLASTGVLSNRSWAVPPRNSRRAAWVRPLESVVIGCFEEL